MPDHQPRGRTACALLPETSEAYDEGKGKEQREMQTNAMTARAATHPSAASRPFLCDDAAGDGERATLRRDGSDATATQTSAVDPAKTVETLSTAFDALRRTPSIEALTTLLGELMGEPFLLGRVGMPPHADGADWRAWQAVQPSGETQGGQAWIALSDDAEEREPTAPHLHPETRPAECRFENGAAGSDRDVETDRLCRHLAQLEGVMRSAGVWQRSQAASPRRTEMDRSDVMEEAGSAVLLYYGYAEVTDVAATAAFHRRLCTRLGLGGKVSA